MTEYIFLDRSLERFAVNAMYKEPFWLGPIDRAVVDIFSEKIVD